ncbi:hypothetical protein C8J56DRAFT_1056630 [Mycena floridula]|nr:hypothetical protein C8J56DRAFT_1056630 [Mycena floridula]
MRCYNKVDHLMYYGTSSASLGLGAEANALQKEVRWLLPPVSHCGWEIDYETCSGCFSEFDISMYYDQADINQTWSITTSEAAHDDRVTAPRGNTPTLAIEIGFVPAEYSKAWPGRAEEYRELLRRGATRLMCETFHLEFNNQHGIVAWADSDLYETFSGPSMQVGDFWKIYLGRSIELDSDDFDGSQFIEDLVEDIHNGQHGHGRWRTTEEAPGIWATRLFGDEFLIGANELKKCE